MNRRRPKGGRQPIVVRPQSALSLVQLSHLSPELARKVICFEVVSFAVAYYRSTNSGSECHISTTIIRAYVRKQHKLKRFILKRWHLDWDMVEAGEVKSAIGQLAQMNPDWVPVSSHGKWLNYVIPTQ